MLIINWMDFCPSWALAPSPAQTQDSLDATNLGDGKVICFQLQGVTLISGWSFPPLIYTFPYLFHLLSLCSDGLFRVHPCAVKGHLSGGTPVPRLTSWEPHLSPCQSSPLLTLCSLSLIFSWLPPAFTCFLLFRRGPCPFQEFS